MRNIYLAIVFCMGIICVCLAQEKGRYILNYSLEQGELFQLSSMSEIVVVGKMMEVSTTYRPFTPVAKPPEDQAKYAREHSIGHHGKLEVEEVLFTRADFEISDDSKTILKALNLFEHKDITDSLKCPDYSLGLPYSKNKRYIIFATRYENDSLKQYYVYPGTKQYDYRIHLKSDVTYYKTVGGCNGHFMILQPGDHRIYYDARTKAYGMMKSLSAAIHNVPLKGKIENLEKLKSSEETELAASAELALKWFEDKRKRQGD